MILSGGNYGGYVIDGNKAILYSTDENGDQIIYDEISVTKSQTVINVNNWLYDTARSAGNDSAEFIIMK